MPHDGPAPLSRGKVEDLMLLEAARDGSDLGTITARLGLADGLAPAVAQALSWLVASGLITKNDDGFTITQAGRQALVSCLEDSEP